MKIFYNFFFLNVTSKWASSCVVHLFVHVLPNNTFAFNSVQIILLLLWTKFWKFLVVVSLSFKSSYFPSIFIPNRIYKPLCLRSMFALLEIEKEDGRKFVISNFQYFCYNFFLFCLIIFSPSLSLRKWVCLIFLYLYLFHTQHLQGW